MTHENVLILVVMEDALRETFKGVSWDTSDLVLILVVMEDALRVWDPRHSDAVPILS